MMGVANVASKSGETFAAGGGLITSSFFFHLDGGTVSMDLHDPILSSLCGKYHPFEVLVED